MLTKINDANFKAEVEDKGGVALVDFGAAWCGPCRALAPILNNLSESYSGDARFYSVDIDESPEVAAQFEIMSVPTVLIFKDGQIVGKSIGLKSQGAFSKMLDEAK